MDISGKHELVRQDDGFIPEKLIVIGNGAIERGWSPVREVLDEMIIAIDDYPIHPRKLGLSESLSLLALQERRSKQFVIRELTSLINGASADFDEMKNSFWYLERICLSFREALAKVYASSREISIKEKVLKVLKEEGLEKSSTAVITTNWDNLLWDYGSERLRNLIHLHGRCSSWETLLLPTETSEENAFFLLMSKDLEERIKNSDRITDKVKENCLLLLRKAFSPPKNESEYWKSFSVHLNYAHGRALKWIREAGELVICGVNFNPFDHELLTVFSDKKVSDSPEKWRKIVIISDEEKEWKKTAGLLKTEIEACTFIHLESFWKKIKRFFSL